MNAEIARDLEESLKRLRFEGFKAGMAYAAVIASKTFEKAGIDYADAGGAIAMDIINTAERINEIPK